MTSKKARSKLKKAKHKLKKAEVGVQRALWNVGEAVRTSPAGQAAAIEQAINKVARSIVTAIRTTKAKRQENNDESE